MKEMKDVHILIYSILSLMIACVFPPLGIFGGAKTYSLAVDALAADEDGVEAVIVKIGTALSVIAVVVGGVLTAAWVVFALMTFVGARAQISALPFPLFLV